MAAKELLRWKAKVQWPVAEGQKSDPEDGDLENHEGDADADANEHNDRHHHRNMSMTITNVMLSMILTLIVSIAFFLLLPAIMFNTAVLAVVALGMVVMMMVMVASDWC